jgi:1,2-phenylacetyl-CoA epoxidase catalytic subunit
MTNSEPEKIIRFETKEESNERRMQEALNRTPHKRLMFFLELSQEMQFFYSGKPHPNSYKNNFILE